jgi:hypothetical protein
MKRGAKLTGSPLPILTDFNHISYPSDHLFYYNASASSHYRISGFQNRTGKLNGGYRALLASFAFALRRYSGGFPLEVNIQKG